ncbi:TrbI/VirB10 family protein [uncultured Roseobacter sp.]|uniref:TrbI/VirB10 family protein n=1 Tax=uncultured Roseobacter sp. TaxID=114847 RepID=UPI0026073645|nr:TrbI/VirB10 family protein [uncultured Roseobacter sp.]
MTPSREDDGTVPNPPKVPPEDLAIRAAPRPVTRINRRVLIALSGTGLLLIFGATIFALDPPRLFDHDDTGRELYRTDNNPTPDGLEALPRRYSDLPKPPVELGPPLPGDLGGPILDAQRERGIDPTGDQPFRSDPEEDAARAERIRQARLAQQGREAGVFFTLTSRTAGATQGGGVTPAGIPSVPTGAASTASSARNPFEVASVTPARNGLELDRENDQNLQGRKLDFLDQDVDADIYNPHALQDLASPYQVMAGTIISASLVTGINSDLPGRIIAQVTENIYDTATGAHLLIPQGARMIGTYDSVVAFGQDRALAVWQRIIMPNGSSVVIENLSATDTAGYAGLKDEVDFHTWRLLKGIALSTLLGVSTELTFGDDESDLVEAIRESTQDSANQAGQRITERNLNVQPTITIRPGWPLRIIVNKDMVLRPYRDLGVAR